MAITPDTAYHFLFGTLAEYKAAKAASKLVATDLYFITDTHQLYVGEDLYTQGCEFVSAFPASPAAGIIYVNTATHEVKVYDGAAWNQMVPPVSSNAATAADADLLTAKAIKDLVSTTKNGLVDDISYDAATQKFTVTYGDATTGELALKNLFTNVAYDGATGKMTFTKANKAEGEQDLVLNLPVENFLANAAYDPETHILTLTMESGDKIEVDLGDLIDVYTVADTNSVDMTMTGNEIKADVKLSSKEGNALSIVAEEGKEGLYVNVPADFIQSIEDTKSVDLTVDGAKLTADVKLSTEANNAIVEKNDGLHVDISGKVDANGAITAGTHTKITYDAKGLVTGGADLAEADIPELHIAKVTDITATAAEINVLDGIEASTAELNHMKGVTSGVQGQLDNKVAKNADITAGTHTKITYDAKGLVTGGADLAASDIPSLELTKISDVTATAAEVNVLDGIEASTAELNYVKGVTSAVQTQLDAKIAKADIADNLTTDDATKVLSAKQGKALKDICDSLSAVGRFLSVWDCTTGKPETDPEKTPYAYHTGDYFIVGKVGETNYKPTGTSYDKTASTVQESEVVAINDVYYFDGTNWKLMINSGRTVTFASIAGKATDNTDLAAELNKKLDANTAITAGTHTKITYDANGLVTAGADLAEADIPSLHLAKVTDVTATAAELNVLDGIEATTTELNIMHGVTATTAELNILDGVTATAAEINVLDGIEASTTELNYVKGVTSAIQTQIDGKAAKATTLAGYGITDAYTKSEIDGMAQWKAINAQ